MIITVTKQTQAISYINYFISTVAYQVFNAVFAGSHLIKNRTQKNYGKSAASILYRKNYKMPYPIFAAILLPFLTHAQENNPSVFSSTRYLCDYTPLAPLVPTKPAAQGIILIKTANAV
jgi:hypothetical protein